MAVIGSESQDVERAVIDTEVITAGVTHMLAGLGMDLEADGLKDTPARVARALKEMTAGYRDDPAAILARTFEIEHDQMVALSNIKFTSLCEHHILPFNGSATVAYIPGRVVGISKLARIVQCYARRLQVQERMTDQIAQAIQEYLEPIGVGVLVRAHHACMGCRGVRQPDAVMVTSCLRGAVKDMPEARAEFLALANGHN